MTTAADLTWRHPTKDDIPAWHELLQAAEVVDQTGENFSEDDLLDEFEAPNHDPENAWFGFTGDGQLVAFGWAYGRSEASEVNRVFLWGCVHPDVRRSGIGRALLAKLEERGRAIHAAVHPDEDGVLELNSADHNVANQALALTAGYQPRRYWFEMRHPLDTDVPEIGEIVVPDGLTLHRYDPAIDEQVRSAHNDAFRDHWGSSPMSEAEWKHVTVGRYLLPEASFVVLDGDEVAGYLISQHYPADAEAKGFSEAWIDTLGTRRQWRKRGVAAALLVAALGAYQRAGFDFGVIGVDANNPSGALRLYERLGFRTVQASISYHKPA